MGEKSPETRCVAALVIGSALLLGGCASTGAPRAPSLMLPQMVRALQVERFGNHVDLHWTTPTSTTDRQPLVNRRHGAGPLTAEVCRVQGSACVVFTRQTVTPGEQASARDGLDAALLLGPARAVRYRVRLLNGAGRSAGWSRDSVAVAGEAPPPIAGLAASTVNQGMQLTWRPARPASGERILLRATSNAAEATDRTLAAPAGAAGTIDIAPHPGDTVRYTVLRTRTVPIDGEQLPLNGEPGTVEATMQKDTFAPEQPRGLVAVAVQMEGASPEIDLSWEPNGEPDLLGYVLYRTEGPAAGGAPTRLNREPVQTVSYRDTTAAPGHTYTYAITAVDRSGNESRRSATAEEQLRCRQNADAHLASPKTVRRHPIAGR